jgi:HD-like signal output (HDOD) protein
MGTSAPDRDKIISTIVNKVSSSRGVPSLSTNLSRVLALSGQQNASVQELAQIILQDYGLTSKVLKVVNSAFYGLGRHKVSTISRAIVLLGFNTIRDVATGMLVFEHFFSQSHRRAEAMDVLTKSFLSAIHAREIALVANYSLPEEAFICSLLHKLGKTVVALYYPRQLEAINRLQAEGRSEFEASQEVLGVSLSEIGRALALEWKLPGIIWQTMDNSDGHQEAVEPGKALLRSITAICNRCVERLCSGEPAGWQEILNLLHKVAPVSEESFLGVIGRSMDTAAAISPMMGKSLNRMGYKERMRELRNPSLEDEEEEVELEEEAEGSPPANTRLLMELMADVTQALTTECSLSQVLTMILETLYRGLGFERVVLGVLTTDRQWLQARFGLGADIDEFIAGFKFPVGRTGFLTQALFSPQDTTCEFEEVEDADFRRQYGSQLAGSTLFVYPVVVRSKVIGCFFAHRPSRRSPTAEEMQSLSILRNYGVLAIERASGRRPQAGEGVSL